MEKIGARLTERRFEVEGQGSLLVYEITPESFAAGPLMGGAG